MKLQGVDLRDGDGWRRGVDLEVQDGRITRIAQGSARDGAPVICPAPIDLQVNGGGGWMLGDCEAPGDALEILAAHRRLGTGAILPTLITDTPENTRRIVDLIATAQAADAGILGLHLEGPHLTRAGAHDARLLRDMTEADIAFYAAARAKLGWLMITVAPERVSTGQIRQLVAADIIVALGHSNADYQTAMAGFEAGARMATHLFNAMSGLDHREPGLAGAALDGAEAFGLIADGYHVHPAALRLALRARTWAAIPVSDAMALTGTDKTEFTLQGRRIISDEGRLSLPDGTLAGAAMPLLAALRNLARLCHAPLIDILPLGFDHPHRFLHGIPNRIAAGSDARLLMLEGETISTLDRGKWMPVAV